MESCWGQQVGVGGSSWTQFMYVIVTPFFIKIAWFMACKVTYTHTHTINVTIILREKSHEMLLSIEMKIVHQLRVKLRSYF